MENTSITETQPVPAQVPSQSQPIPPQKKQKQFLWIILTIILILLIGSGGGYLGLKAKKPLLQTQATQISPTPTPISTANWKTYSNTKVGFQFKYPPSFTPPELQGAGNPTYADGSEDSTLIGFQSTAWPAKGSTAYSLTFFPSSHSISDLIAERKRAISWSQILPQFYPDKPTTLIKSSTIGGITAQWYATSHVNTDKSTGIEIYFFNTNHAFILRTGDNSVLNQNELNQIISTFKFTDQNQGIVVTPSVSPATSNLTASSAKVLVQKEFDKEWQNVNDGCSLQKIQEPQKNINGYATVITYSCGFTQTPDIQTATVTVSTSGIVQGIPRF